MRSSTRNRFIGVWDYDPRYNSSDGCAAGANNMWTLAEVAAAQTKNATASNQTGTYFWPIRPQHRAIGPSAKDAGSSDCFPQFKTIPEILDIFCGVSSEVCAGAEQTTGCDASPWLFKLGIQWEVSANNGFTWFRLPQTSLNLSSPRLTIGSAIPATTRADWISAPPTSDTIPVIDDIFLPPATQFYGVIDSVRISRGVARYVNQVVQPYHPRAQESELIDEFVTFALNLGDTTHRKPGGNIFPYYVKGRGWLTPNQPAYTGNTSILAPEVRYFYRNNTAANTDILIDTNNNDFGPTTTLAFSALAQTNQTTSGGDFPVLASGGDPYFSDVWLLLSRTGVDGSTTITDASSNNRVINRWVQPPYSDITLSSTSKWPGGLSVLFFADMGENYWAGMFGRLSCEIPENAITTQNWVIEFWAKPSAIDYGSFFSVLTGDGFYFYGLWCRLDNGTIRLVDASMFDNLISGGGVVADTWTYIAISFSNGTLRLYQDGQKIGETTATLPSGSTLYIGNSFSFESGTPYRGYLDDFRVTLGNDRGYTGATIPVPIEAFPTSSGPATEPTAPRNLAATAGDAQISLSWLTPLSSGGSVVTAYIVEYTASGGAPQTVSVGVTPRTFNLTAATHGITNNTEYSVRIAAVNAVGTGPYSAAVTVTPTPPPPPDAPTITRNEPASGAVFLQWTTPQSYGVAITDYVIEYTLDGGSPATVNVGSAATSFTVTGLTNFTQYAFRVAGITSSGTGTYSAAVNETPTPSPPGPPTAVTATASNAKINVSWQAPLNDGGSPITDYKILLTSDPTSDVIFTGSTTTSFELTGLVNGVQYAIKVATVALGTSAYSAPTVYATPNPTPPTPPTDLTAASNNASVNLSWQAPIDNGGSAVTGYTVRYRPVSESDNFITITTPNNNTSFIVTGLTNGVAYAFSVAANNALGSSPYSAAATATPSPVAPAVPANLLRAADNESVYLSWQAPASNGGTAITAYKIQYTPAGGSPTTITTINTLTFYTLTGLTNGTEYSIRVAAVNSAGTGDYTTAVLATPSPSPPDDYFNNVALLLHMDGANGSKNFFDSSKYDHAVTAAGDAQISTAESQWGLASGVFDGSGDYIIVPAHSSLTFGSTADFTVECLVRFPTTPNSWRGFANSVTSTTSADLNKWYFGWDGANLVFGRHSTSDGVRCAWAPEANRWYHVAAVRVAGIAKLYIDGVAQTVTGENSFSNVYLDNSGVTVGVVATPHYHNGYIDDFRITNGVARYTQATVIPPQLAFKNRGPASTLPPAPTDLAIVSDDTKLWLSWSRPATNGDAAITSYLVQYYSNTGPNPGIIAAPLVIPVPQPGAAQLSTVIGNLLNGVEYTVSVAAVNDVGAGDFGPPVLATPNEPVDGFFPAVTLLMHMDEDKFFDRSKYSSDPNPFGALISSAQSKFGTKSGHFSGNGKRIEIADNDTQFYFGSGDYTVEAWLYVTAVDGNDRWFISQLENSYTDNNRQFAFGFNNSNLRVYWTTNGADHSYASFPATIPLNKWVHVAFCRASNNLRAFVDGVPVGNPVAHTAVYFNSNAPLCIGTVGQYTEAYALHSFVGYINELRITKNVARYAVAFSKPAIPFPNKGPTVALSTVPTTVSISANVGELLASWRKPTDTGGLAILGYQIKYKALSGPAAEQEITINTPDTETHYKIYTSGADDVVIPDDVNREFEVKIAAVTQVGVGAFCNPVIAKGGVTLNDSAPATGYDAEFSKVSLLLHCDGANNGTVFADFSESKTPSNRTAVTRTNIKKFGTASGFFSTTQIAYASHSSFGFGLNEFTIEMFIYPLSSADSRQALLSLNQYTNGLLWRLFTAQGDRGTFWFKNAAKDWTANGEKSPLQDTWSHVAMTREGNRFRIFVNGKKRFDQDLGPVDLGDTVPFTIGQTPHALGVAESFNGYIDEIRVTKGFARYTATDFKPPTREFSDRSLIVTTPARPTKLRAYPRDQRLTLNWQKPANTGGVRLVSYVIEYTPFGAPAVVINTNSAQTTYDLTGLVNNTRYDIRVAAINDFGQGPYSFITPRTPEEEIVNYFDVHRYLSYSNRETGYQNRCGIQFPYIQGGPDVSHFLLIEDFTLPVKQAYARILDVDCATTETLIADYAGRFWGKEKTIDEFKTAPGRTVLVKDQDDPALNGVYVVQNDILSGNTATPQPWRRLAGSGTGGLDNFTGASVRVLRGRENVGTVWNATTNNPVIGETPIIFVQDQLVGVYRDDFCVEAYFKAHRFRHPALDTKGQNMTLLDAYHRCSFRDEGGSPGNPIGFSGVRIYFECDATLDTELVAERGRLLVDVGPYDRAPAPPTSGNNTGILIEPDAGPALRSKILDAGRFYHVAVTRADDVFRLYIDGVLQDQFLAQETRFKPANLSAETNYLRYRVRPYFGVNDYGASQYLSFFVRRSEFYHTPESVPQYAWRFNGGAGMIRSNDAKLLNLPDANGVATWPGKPIPDYPADAHIYIVNDVSLGIRSPLDFLVIPKLRFPVETVEVELATVVAGEEYMANNGIEYEIPNSGNIPLFGITKIGTPAEGTIEFRLLASTTFSIPQSTTFSANSVNFSPWQTYTAVFKPVGQALLAGELRIIQDGSQFLVVVPVIAQTRTSDGNVNVNTVFSTTSTFANLISLKAASNFQFGTNDTDDPLTIDGVPVEAGMRILVKNQNNAAQHGIYVVSESAWTRAADMNQTSEISRGRRVYVKGGYTNSGDAFILNIAAAIKDADIAINVTPITFPKDEDPSSAGTKFLATGQFDEVVGTGLEVETNDPVLAVTCITTQEIPLFGLPASAATDGFPVKVNQLVLVKEQTDKAQNGVYRASNTAWRRVPYLSLSSHFVNNLLISPRVGDSVPTAPDGEKIPVAYRMQIPPEFEVDVDEITFTAQAPLTKLHFPFYWTPAEIESITIDPITGLPQISSGATIEWNDYIPDASDVADGATNDKTVWRIRYQCGKTVAYSRAIILRSAAKLGVTQVTETGIR